MAILFHACRMAERGNIIVGINSPDILSSKDEMINFVLAKI